MAETRGEFIEQYRRLCGHIARAFVSKWRRNLISNGGLAQGSDSNYAPHIQASRTLQFKAEDLASAALLKLCKCKPEYWNQPYYVKRLIVNAIIDEQKFQQKTFEHEWQAPKPDSRGSNSVYPMVDDWFDQQPGRDGLAEATRIKLDSEAIRKSFICLTSSERIVIEMYYGLKTKTPLKEYAIASRLGKDRGWVERKLKAGLNAIRREIGEPVRL